MQSREPIHIGLHSEWQSGMRCLGLPKRLRQP